VSRTKKDTMTITAKTWTYDQYLAAVLPQGVAATVWQHDLADGHQIGRNDGLDDWLDQSEATTWREDLSMSGEEPEEWCGFHQLALAELVAAIEAANEDEDEDEEDEEDEEDKEDEESKEDAAYSLAQCVEAMAYADYLAAATGPKAPAAYAAYTAAQAATEAARVARRDAALRGKS